MIKRKRRYELTEEAIKTIDWKRCPWRRFMPNVWKYPLLPKYVTKENGGYYQYKPNEAAQEDITNKVDEDTTTEEIKR